MTTDVKGTSVMIGAIAPIPLISPVQSTACDRLAGQLKSFLLGSGEETAASLRAAVVDSPSLARACCAPGDLNLQPAVRIEWRSAVVQVMGRRVLAATAATPSICVGDRKEMR